jgi:oligopeptide transport system substrate-binding protein
MRKSIKIRLISITIITTVVVLFNNSCGKNNNKSATDNSLNSTATSSTKQLNVDMGAEIPSIDPQLVEDNNSTRVATDLFQSVVKLDQSNVPTAALAKNWQVSSDGKTYTFHLRDNLKFSNGAPIEASDIVFSWQRLVDPQTGSPYTYIATSIINADKITSKQLPVSALGVKAVDDKTVELQLAYPDSDILAKLALPAFAVVNKDSVVKYGKQWTDPKNLVTSGAYFMKEHVVNGYLLITKNPYYYAANQVKINEVKFYPLVDTNTALAKYKAGNLDMTWTTPIDQHKELSLDYKDQLHTTPMEGLVYYDLNMLRPEFKDVRVRQALSLAIDRVVLTKEVLGTGVVPSYSPVTPSVDGGKYTKAVYPWINDARSSQIAQAQQLYKAAGYSATNPLKLTITYATDDERKKVALAVASMWQNVLGAQVEVQNTDWKTFLESLRNGGYQIAADRWIADYNGVTTYTQMYVCNAAENSAKYCNPDYDKYIKLATYETNAEKRADYYNKALNIVVNDSPMIPLYQPAIRRLVNPEVKGYTLETNHLDKPASEWMYFGSNNAN